jgi:hypothetical protein
MKNTNRLLSLDALRGFDLFFIMGGGSLILALAQFLPASACSLTLFALFFLLLMSCFGGVGRFSSVL